MFSYFSLFCDAKLTKKLHRFLLPSPSFFYVLTIAVIINYFIGGGGNSHLSPSPAEVWCRIPVPAASLRSPGEDGGAREGAVWCGDPPAPNGPLPGLPPLLLSPHPLPSVSRVLEKKPPSSRHNRYRFPDALPASIPRGGG